jgi:hypothetical protein
VLGQLVKTRRYHKLVSDGTGNQKLCRLLVWQSLVKLRRKLESNVIVVLC